MSVFWIPVVAIPFSILPIIVIIIANARSRQREAQLRADVQMKLIDRFGTADEFVDFIKSNEGREFLGDAPRAARKGYIGGIRWGIISMFLGLAFIGCAIAEQDADFLIPAFIILGIGAGFFVAAMASIRLARDMEKNEKQ